jgi:hypothetical protein
MYNENSQRVRERKIEQGRAEIHIKMGYSLANILCFLSNEISRVRNEQIKLRELLEVDI